MISVGFEPMIPVFKRVKIVHALDCSATLIGYDITSATGCSNKEETGQEVLSGDNIIYSNTFGSNHEMSQEPGEEILRLLRNPNLEAASPNSTVYA
jgi:hypothetical protein